MTDFFFLSLICDWRERLKAGSDSFGSKYESYFAILRNLGMVGSLCFVEAERNWELRGFFVVEIAWKNFNGKENPASGVLLWDFYADFLLCEISFHEMLPRVCSAYTLEKVYVLLTNHTMRSIVLLATGRSLAPLFHLTHSHFLASVCYYVVFTLGFRTTVWHRIGDLCYHRRIFLSRSKILCENVLS